jgi:hypothetical protein
MDVQVSHTTQALLNAQEFSLSTVSHLTMHFQTILIHDKDYGPTLYKNLGFTVAKQLLYPAAWLTFTLGMNLMTVFIIDRLPRNRLMGIGVIGAECTLIIEAALVANFVPSTNSAALQAAVAMFFIYQIFYSLGCDGMNSLT